MLYMFVNIFIFVLKLLINIHLIINVTVKINKLKFTFYFFELLNWILNLLILIFINKSNIIIINNFNTN